LEPQITPGQLTDATGIPLMVNAFEDNKADTTTMVPTIQAFMDAHQLPDVTAVADAGTVSLAPSRSLGDVFTRHGAVPAGSDGTHERQRA
jgi:transposase